MYIYSTILLIAVLVNLIYAMVYAPDYDLWYHLTHKVQLLLVLLSGYFYEHNWVNFIAGSAYGLIIIMNWLLYVLGVGHTLSIASGILYAVALLVILIIEKWKNL